MNNELVIADNLPGVKHETGVAQVSSREQFQIQAGFIMAERRPRDEMKSFTKLLKTYERPSAALGAEYSFPRGGKTISGPSVILAREAAKHWGNIRAGVVVVAMDDNDVHLKGSAWDLETNAYFEQEGHFKKRIQRKDKRTGVTEWVTPDERDLRELINKHGAILERNCILRLIPKDFIEDAVAKARHTLTAKARGELEKNKEDTIKVLLLSFKELDVSQDMIEALLGHAVLDVNADEIADLRQKYQAIKTGEATREEYFEIPKPKSEKAMEGLNSELKGLKAGAEPGKQPGQQENRVGGTKV